MKTISQDRNLMNGIVCTFLPVSLMCGLEDNWVLIYESGIHFHVYVIDESHYS